MLVHQTFARCATLCLLACSIGFADVEPGSSTTEAQPVAAPETAPVQASAPDEASATTPTGVQTEILPSGRLFRRTFADPREIRMALMMTGDQKFLAAIGNYLSVVGLRTPGGTRYHFGLEGAGYFTMHEEGSRFPLESVDGLLGVYAEAEMGKTQMQLRYTHISAHLADGSTGTAIPYSREFAVLRWGYLPSPDLHVYTGVRMLTNSIPAVPGFAAQTGFSYFFPIDNALTPFIATDLQWEAQSSFNPTVSIQIGIALNRSPDRYRSFRLFYSYFSGEDPRGQFLGQPLTYQSLGLEMQI